MSSLSRRELFWLGIAAASGLAAVDPTGVDLHRQLLDLASRFEKQRRDKFAAVTSKEQLSALQNELRSTFLRLLGGLPKSNGIPPVTKTGKIEAEDYRIEKLSFESFPGYHVPALLYVPKKHNGAMPGVLSPCGHSPIGKAYNEYQIMHINLVKRGFVVLTYDPVGQSERSQFWDAANQKSRFNLVCGEHAVLGNALDLLGLSLARYRIWDGMRGIDYLISRPEVDATKIGCVGNSGGGTLTAYITALDHRVSCAAICCYITTLPRRMGNRIQEDPSSDPEQDLPGFVSDGIDHAGLLALCAPRPTLIGAATQDFFPIQGTRESFAEAKHLYEAAGIGDRIAMAEAPVRHGMSLPLREAVYDWFGRWLLGQDKPVAKEIATTPRPAAELLVSADGQVNLSLKSRPLFSIALEEFRNQPKPARRPLREILHLDLDQADPLVENVEGVDPAGKTLLVFVNGNESADWRESKGLFQALAREGHSAVIVEPRGVGSRRIKLSVNGRSYADPISSVEANLAYNAFLVGRSLLGLRVADVLAAVNALTRDRKPRRVFVCGRRDAAIVACLAAAVEKNIDGIAVEEMVGSLMPLFSRDAQPMCASGIVPGFLRDFGDFPELIDSLEPRKIFLAAMVGKPIIKQTPSTSLSDVRFSLDHTALLEWLRR